MEKGVPGFLQMGILCGNEISPPPRNGLAGFFPLWLFFHLVPGRIWTGENPTNITHPRPLGSILFFSSSFLFPWLASYFIS